MLYAFCQQHGVPHVRCGKLIVATDASDVGRLESLRETGQANGVGDLTIVDRAAVLKREPAVNAVAALLSPSSGIVDADALVRALGDRAEAMNAQEKGREDPRNPPAEMRRRTHIRQHADADVQ